MQAHYARTAMEGSYPGVETLEALEAEVQNYQRFLTRLIAELGRSSRQTGTTRVLDFGAGTGTYARHARALGYAVVCVELDDHLRDRLTEDCFVVSSGLDAVPEMSQQAVYSFNVLEHIENDQGSLRELFRVMAPGGRLLLYVPAFPVLFSAFDHRVGHVRRYRRAELLARVQTAGFEVDRCVYADSLGFAASLAYRIFSRGTSGALRPGAVRAYDRFLFPLSRRLDGLLQHRFGKNLVLTAHRPLPASTG